MKISQETLDILNEQGYNNLNEYLQYLADDYGIQLGHLEDLALTLGESELFDGLVTACEDYGIYDSWKRNECEED